MTNSGNDVNRPFRERLPTSLAAVFLACSACITLTGCLTETGEVEQNSPPTQPETRWRIEGPDDFRRVVQGALAEADRSLPALNGSDQRSDNCLQDFTVTAAWELDNRADYREGQIRIRVPATAPRIEELTIHELAHHLDATCPAVDEIRSPFQTAQNTDSRWDSGPTWEQTPAEQFAEALTLVVLGRQRSHNVIVYRETVDLVERWATEPSS